MRVPVLIASLCLCLLAPPASACTTVQVKTEQGIFVGKGYDWSLVAGHVIFNKKGVAKVALLVDKTDKPATWQSQHASLTFNQYGRELPNGGMNDAGLMVEVMLLRETLYPPRDDRRAVNELQWIQVQLDSYATVAEVVAHAADLRVSPLHGMVHYLTCDRSGACAAVEFVKGKLVVTHGAAMVANTLTNSTYAESVRTLRTYQGFGGKLAIPPGIVSTVRFARATRQARQASTEDPVKRTLAVLDAVRIDTNPTGNVTKWQLVYDLAKLRVSWRTAESSAIRSATLSEAKPGCRTAVTFADINAARPSFKVWTVAANKALLESVAKVLAGKLPEGALDTLAAYPSRLLCAGSRTPEK